MSQTSPTQPLPAAVQGLLDDAAAGPQGSVGLHDAAAAHTARRSEEYGGVVASLVVRDTEVPLLRGSPARLTVLVTGGAGQVAGPAAVGRRLGLDLGRLVVALRDLDDLAGNARRVVAAVDAARAEGSLAADVAVHVGLPPVGGPGGPGGPGAGWLAAADEVAAAELLLELTDGPGGPDALAAQVDAALDRETPFSVTGGAEGAGPTSPVALLRATVLAFDGAPREEVVAALGAEVAGVDDSDPAELARARRWLRSVVVADVAAGVARLRAAGLLR